MGSESISLKPVINLGNSIVGVSILAVPYCYSQVLLIVLIYITVESDLLF